MSRQVRGCGSVHTRMKLMFELLYSKSLVYRRTVDQVLVPAVDLADRIGVNGATLGAMLVQMKNDGWIQRIDIHKIGQSTHYAIFLTPPLLDFTRKSIGSLHLLPVHPQKRGIG